LTLRNNIIGVLHNLYIYIATMWKLKRGFPMVIERGRRREHSYPTRCTTTKKKARGKAGHAQNILPDRAASGHDLFRSRDFRKSRDWRHFRSKGTTRANIAQLPVAHAEHITIHVTWLTSLPVTWHPVAPPHSTPTNDNLSVPIYYSSWV
jgi:hypothetical protein